MEHLLFEKLYQETFLKVHYAKDKIMFLLVFAIKLQAT